MHPDPNPKPDVQVSKHPAFQMILFSFIPRGFEVMATPTQGLDVVQAVRHVEVGKTVDRDDVIRTRGLGCDHDRASTAMKAVADQSLPLEVSASGPPTIGEYESSFPFVVFRVRLVTAGLIWLR